MPARQLVAALRAEGLRLPRSAGEALDLVLDAIEEAAGEARGLWHIRNDLTVQDMGVVLDGCTFTHRLTDLEVETDSLLADFDISGMPLDHLMGSGLTLPDNRMVRATVVPLDGQVRLQFVLAPSTWAELGRSVGDLIGVSFTAGVARLVMIDEVADTPDDLGEDLFFLLHPEDPDLREPVASDDLVDELLQAGDYFTRPLAPLSEILVSEGFAVAGDRAASSAQLLAEDETERLARSLENRFELNPEEADSVATIIELVRVMDDAMTTEGAPEVPADGPPSEAQTAALVEWVEQRVVGVQRYLSESGIALVDIREDLAEPWIAEIVASVSLDMEHPSPEGLTLLAEFLAETPDAPPSRDESASVAYLAGRCHEFVGDPLAAESDFHRAIALAPFHTAALVSLAGIAADRGTFEVAASLLDRAGAPDEHPLRMAVRSVDASASAPERLPGRNEPCWCGSGRKYKVCHARSSTVPLPARANSILHRALAWAAVTDSGLLQELLVYGLQVGGRDAMETVVEILPDAVLFEGGALADYLDRRRALIPADELMLAQGWLLRPRSVFDVEEVMPEGLGLRDLMTGDRTEVFERAASKELKRGDLILTRVAPMVEDNRIYGGVIPIQLGERDALLALLAEEPTPPDMIGFVARRFRMPSLVTPEGEPMVSAVGTYTTTAPKRLRSALDARFQANGDDTWDLVEDGRAGGTRVLASLTLTGRTLEVSAMSEARFARVLEILDGVDAPLVERSREVTDMATLAAQARPEDGDAPESLLDPDDPAVQEAVAALVADFERSWLDESIPALGGITPREAAEDPTRREDLIRLLNTFPAAGKPTEMDGSRLRAALGL